MRGSEPFYRSLLSAVVHYTESVVAGIKGRMNIFIRRVAKDRTHSSDTQGPVVLRMPLKIAVLMTFIDSIDCFPSEIVSCVFCKKSRQCAILYIGHGHGHHEDSELMCGTQFYCFRIVSNMEHGKKHDIYKDIFCKSDDLPCVIFLACHLTPHPIPMSPPRRIKQIELRISLK